MTTYRIVSENNAFSCPICFSGKKLEIGVESVFNFSSVFLWLWVHTLWSPFCVFSAKNNFFYDVEELDVFKLDLNAS